MDRLSTKFKLVRSQSIGVGMGGDPKACFHRELEFNQGFMSEVSYSTPFPGGEWFQKKLWNFSNGDEERKEEKKTKRKSMVCKKRYFAVTIFGSFF